MTKNLDFNCPSCHGLVGRPRYLGTPVHCPQCNVYLMPVVVSGIGPTKFFYRPHKLKGNPLRADLERS